MTPTTQKISADEDVRVKTLSIGVVIPDKFVELAREDKAAYVFYPHTIYKEYGQHMDEMDMTAMYEELVDNDDTDRKRFDTHIFIRRNLFRIKKVIDIAVENV